MSFLLFGFFLIYVDSQANYDFDCQGSDWPLDFPECGGMRQSPINIDTGLIDCTTPLILSNQQLRIDDNPRRVFEVTNNGVFINVQEKPGPVTGAASVLTDVKGQRYIFDSIHWHWGSINTQGSEHTFDDEQAPIEAHLVHYWDRASSVAEAIAQYQANNSLITLAVVGVLFEIGRANSEIDNILDNIDIGTITRLKLSSFIPTNRQYITYDGSLTTPPCLETVKWHLMTNRVTLSIKQLNRIRFTFDRDGNFLFNNFRLTQPINDRFIKYCGNDNFHAHIGRQVFGGLIDTMEGDNGKHNQIAFIILFILTLILISLGIYVIIRRAISGIIWINTKNRNHEFEAIKVTDVDTESTVANPN